MSYVVRDSLKASVVGIVVPDPNILKDYAAQLAIEGDHSELCLNS